MAKITMQNGKLSVPDNPTIPFIEGDGTGPDIWRASVRVFDAAVAKAYGGKKKIEWMEVLAGEKAFNQTQNWLPAGKLTVGITAGASCPNNLIEDTIRRLFELRGVSVQELLAT